jgi:hypothetical protein
MRGSHPAGLRKIDGSTQVPARAWNNARTPGVFFHQKKLEKNRRKNLGGTLLDGPTWVYGRPYGFLKNGIDKFY